MVKMLQGKVKKNRKSQVDEHFAYSLGKILIVIYFIVLTIFYLTYNVFPGIEYLVLCFLIYAAYKKWTRRFIKDWFPFVALFLAYQAMYGIADNISGFVHVQELINAELQIFGVIPTLVLQQFYRTAILDYFGAFCYSLHFLIPTVFAFILWRYSPENYRKYTVAFLLCTYGALITFLVFPSAPPWFALKADRILFQIDHQIGVPVYATIFDLIQPNPFAAFPSLHATYPWLISLYAIKIKRIKALPILLIPLGIFLSAVYLGEHYIIDLLGGIAYSTFALFIAEKMIPRFSFQFTTPFFKRQLFRRNIKQRENGLKHQNEN